MNGPGEEVVDERNRISRRDLIRFASMGAVMVGGGAALATSSPPSAWAASGSGPSGPPKRGGTLRVGVSGGGPSDTLDAQQGVLASDFARIFSLFEPLVMNDLDARPAMILAESMNSNANGTVWTVKLRPDVLFHNGKTLSAEDVIFSLNRVIKHQYEGFFALAPIDAPNMKALDSLTVHIPMKKAYPDFINFYCSLYQNLMIVPTGYNPKTPNGTGAFKYQSFTPGQASTFVRNASYWQEGLPYVDTLVITDYPDENSQINALLSSEVDGVNLLSASSVSRLQNGYRAVIAKTGCNTPFTMRVDQPPFNDVRVRQAFRLLVDRPQMNNVVWGGLGTIANDIFDPSDPEYNHSLPQRVQDIPQAKSLLKAAGHENLTVTLVTSPIFAGCLSVAQVFASQAAAAGVTVNLNQVTPTALFGSSYKKWTFAQDFWYETAYLPQVATEFLPTGPYNETHWDNPHYFALYNEAFATSNSSLRKEIVHEMQVIDYKDGSLIIPYFTATIDGLANNVGGVKPGQVGYSFGNWSFHNMWLS